MGTKKEMLMQLRFNKFDNPARSEPRNKRRSWALLATLALMAGLLAPLTVATPAQAALTTVGPVDPDNGYPKWFGDPNGLRLEACLDPADPF